MLKVAVLGAGFMGGVHARAFARLPGVQVAGVSSRSTAKAEALAAEVGAQPFADALALATDAQIEAVSVTLPTNLHKEAVVAALQAGKHVFVEKPMALTVAECDAMIAAAQDSGRLLMVAHVLRFWPEYVALVDLVQSGALGKPMSAVATRLAEPPAWSEWFKDPTASGGEILDLHIHDLDTLNWLFGEPRALMSIGRQGAYGGWDQAMTLLDYGEVKGCAEGNALMPRGYPFTMTLAVRCELGTVEYTLRAGGEQVDAAAAGVNSLMVYKAGEAPQRLDFTAGDGYANEVAYFVQCVTSGQSPGHGTAEQGRLAVKTALAARRSIETGQVVAL